MRSLSPARRALIGALAVMQMAVPALVSAADARLAATSPGAGQTHVEDHTRRSCVPAHPDDCALCKVISHFAPQRSSGTTLPDPMVERDVGSAATAHRPASIACALPCTRAPPVG